MSQQIRRGYQPSAFRAVALALVAAVGWLATPAGAQGLCGHGIPRSVAQCALVIDGDYLLQGSHRETVAMADRFTALPLGRFVAGDSANKYAARYERRARWGGGVRFAGGALLFAGSVTLLSRSRRDASQSVRLSDAGPALMLSGVTAQLVSYPLRRFASMDARRAVIWNNKLLTGSP
jgi:hypothetical protein